ncbi:MAG: hypothetical protein ACE14T_02230 [Syntrophales bacterium]
METQAIGREQLAVRAMRFVMTGSLAEGIAGGAAVALAIIGLANILPEILLAIATICIGIAFLFEGGAVAARFSTLIRETSGGVLDAAEFGLGMTSEIVGGVAGVALGILALLGLVPLILVPAAVIVYGGTMIFTSGLASRLNNLEIESSTQNEAVRGVAREAVSAATGVELLMGIGVITLGILALVGLVPLVLSLVAVLVVGVSDFLTGTAVTAKMWNVLRQ